MNPINGTNYLRRMESRPDFSILLLGLLILSVVVAIAIMPVYFHRHHKMWWEQEIKNPVYEFNMDSIPKIYLRLNGTIYLDGALYNMKNVPQLCDAIKTVIRKNSLHREKLALIADERIEYGYIVEVLEQIRKANITSVYLTDQHKFSILDVMRESQARKRI